MYCVGARDEALVQSPSCYQSDVSVEADVSLPGILFIGELEKIFNIHWGYDTFVVSYFGLGHTCLIRGFVPNSWMTQVPDTTIGVPYIPTLSLCRRRSSVDVEQFVPSNQQSFLSSELLLVWDSGQSHAQSLRRSPHLSCL